MGTTVQYWNDIPIINDSTPNDFLFNFKNEDGCVQARGAVPRDYSVQPLSTFAPPSNMDLIPSSDYASLIEERKATGSALEDIYLGGAGGEPEFVNLDQNGDGYCWGYSTTHAVMLIRLRDNQPYVRLNPHSLCAIIKRGADEGGWCGLSAEFLRKHGVAEEGNGPGQWPLHSRSLSHDNAAMRERAARYKVTEEWVDLNMPVYSQNLTKQMIATCLLKNQPCALDFSWWGHSVCGISCVMVDGQLCWLILNSWKNWGRNGLGIIQGERMQTMGAVCLRTVRASTLVEKSDSCQTNQAV